MLAHGTYMARTFKPGGTMRSGTLGVALFAAQIAGQVVAQSPSQVAAPSPAPTPARVWVPALPHEPGLREVLSNLRNRIYLKVDWKRTELAGVATRLSTASGIEFVLSARVSKTPVTFETTDRIGVLDVLHRVCLSGDVFVVIERNNTVRILSAKEFKARAKTAGALGIPAPSYQPTMEFRILAVAKNKRGAIDFAEENGRLKKWLAKKGNRKAILANPLRIARFQGLSKAEGGPAKKGFRWYPHRVLPRSNKAFHYAFSRYKSWKHNSFAVFDAERFDAGPRGADDELLEFMMVDMQERSFDSADLHRPSLKKSKSAQTGTPTLVYAMVPKLADDYADFSERHIGHSLASIVDGCVLSAPIFRSRIPGVGQIQGMTERRIDALLEKLRSK